MIAHDLAADQSNWGDAVGFTIGKGWIVWESAQYGPGQYVKVSRLDFTSDARLRQFTQYISPNTTVHLVVRNPNR